MTEVVEQAVEKTWPPTDKEIKDIACAGLNQSDKKRCFSIGLLG